MKQFDASLLQFAPKGSFYNTQDEQLKKIEEVWRDFFNYDRDIFSLSTILPGTAYSKGRMAHMLLSNPIDRDNKSLVPYGLNDKFESTIINWNLEHESMARSLKNLLMLTGPKGKNKSLKRVNNARTKKVILRYIFDRDINSLESMAIKFKSKITKLIRHALGKDLLKVVNAKNGTPEGRLAYKYVTRYNMHGMNIIRFLFGGEVGDGLKKLKAYRAVQNAAKSKDVDAYIKIAEMKVLPVEVLMGFRNTYKLDIDKDKIYEFGKMSERQKIQSKVAAGKAGVEIDIDYSKHDIYDLWKLFYLQTVKEQTDDIDEIAAAITKKSEEKLGIDLGDTVVIFDVSKSMEGSVKRQWHPFLTGLSLISKLDNVKEVIFAGGKIIKTGSEKIPSVIIPSGSTALWKALIEAAEHKPKTVVVVSDGYENEIKGSFDGVYTKLKEDGASFNLIHANPVFSSEVSGLKQLAEDVQPMALDNYKYLKTNLIFKLITTDKEQVKKLFANEYKKQITKEV